MRKSQIGRIESGTVNTWTVSVAVQFPSSKHNSRQRKCYAALKEKLLNCSLQGSKRQVILCRMPFVTQPSGFSGLGSQHWADTDGVPPPMICGVTRPGIDPWWTYCQEVTVTEVHYTLRINCSGCIRTQRTWVSNMFPSILLHPRRTVKASVCVCTRCLVSQMQLLWHSGVETLRGCQLLDPFCCPTQFTHTKAFFSVSRQAFSIMFQGTLTFLGQTCCRWTCRAKAALTEYWGGKKGSVKDIKKDTNLPEKELQPYRLKASGSFFSPLSFIFWYENSLCCLLWRVVLYK